MGIKLTTEVKEVIHQMIAITKEFEPGMMNTLVLFDALLLNRLFATSMEVSSSCKLELISDDVQRILRNGYCEDANEEGNKTEKNSTDAVFSSEHETKTTESFIESKAYQEDDVHIFTSCIVDACGTNCGGIDFSQDLADVFTYAIQIVTDEKREWVTLKDIAISFSENLSKAMMELLVEWDTDISEFQKNYNEATSNMKQEFYIPTSLTGCVTILNSKFIDNPNCEILGRDAECEEIWRNMMKKTKRNVILVGKPGVGKSSIVYKLTSDIVNQRCPEMFNDFIVLSLDVNNIISGTTLRGQAEERFQDLIELMKKHNNVILFIDEIHMIVGAGATTDEEYAQTFGREGALRRRFKTITVREPRTTEVYDMLKEAIRQLEEFHGVRISKKMVEMIIFYSSCFNYNTSNPDRTKDLIDVSMVTARMSGKDRVDRESIMKNFGANFEEFRNMSEEMVRSTAYHEVGHFIVQRFSDKLIDRKAIAISIVPAEGYLGLTVTDATDKTVNKDKSYFTDLIADLLAGRIAEKLFMKSENNAGAESDLEKATKIAFKMVTKYGMTSRLGENQIYLNDKDYQMQTPAVTEIVNREVQKILEEAAKKATLVLDEHQEVVEELVNELTKKGMLSGKELDSIIEHHERKQTVAV